MRSRLLVPLLALAAGAAHGHDKKESEPLKVTSETLAGAKVQLCKDFAESTTEYYLEHKMPKEFDLYRQATEFESDKKAALLEQSLRRIREHSAAAFDPRLTYQVKDRTAYLSEFQPSPAGFFIRLPGATQFEPGTYRLPNGMTQTGNLPEAFGLKNLLDDTGIRSTLQSSLWSRTIVDLDAQGEPVPQTKYEVRSNVVTRRASAPFILLNYGLMPKDRNDLQAQADDSNTIFVPVPETQAREIAEIYRGQKERHAIADYLVKIDKCVQDPPGSNSLLARLVGFRIYAAKLEKKFLETQPGWKRKALIVDWRSAELEP